MVAFLSGFDKIVDPSRQLIAFFRSVSSIRVQYELIAEAMRAKLAKNERRYPVAKARGSNKKYNEL